MCGHPEWNRNRFTRCRIASRCIEPRRQACDAITRCVMYEMEHNPPVIICILSPIVISLFGRCNTPFNREQRTDAPRFRCTTCVNIVQSLHYCRPLYSHLPTLHTHPESIGRQWLLILLPIKNVYLLHREQIFSHSWFNLEFILKGGQIFS